MVVVCVCLCLLFGACAMRGEGVGDERGGWDESAMKTRLWRALCP